MPPLDLTNEPLNVAAFYDWKIDTSALDEAEAVIVRCSHQTSQRLTDTLATYIQAAQIARKAAVGESTAFDADSWAWSVSPDNVAGWSPAAPSVAPSATPFAAPSAALAKTDETWQLGLPTALPKTSGIFGTDTRTPGAQECMSNSCSLSPLSNISRESRELPCSQSYTQFLLPKHSRVTLKRHNG
ncbi:hypothetical protein N658DRAFT_499076 [Parathielavia hyrcaniae]|uniref:Uncharacterized protein n=1 Tax=Parathielavia hyrcaniae TaxID=113614 RepID=A0AAN6SZ62_9PEZI|nr:hypothetical protein N658DRAFT_499076 [Parathielavia hyrcaniae]